MRDYNEHEMTIFGDGSHLNGVSVEELEKKDFKCLVDEVKSFGCENLEVVYSTEFDYCFIAYIGIADYDFEWDDKMNELDNDLSNYLENKGILFQ